MMATQIVHWPGQDTPCCDNHARVLKSVGDIMGCRISSTPCTTETLCTNCFNEARVDEPCEGGVV